jgi:Uma2 family endonuclease
MNAILRPAEIELAPVPMTVEEFEVVLETGLFEDRIEKIELIDGAIVMAPAPGNEHGLSAESATMTLVRALVLLGIDGDIALRPECTLVVDRLSMLVPDLAIVPRGRAQRIAPGEALVVIEIAWSSFDRDTGLKARKYAAAGVPEYWVLDVAAKAVIVHTGPGPEGWSTVRTLESGEVLTATREPRLSVAVADLF